MLPLRSASPGQGRSRRGISLGSLPLPYLPPRPPRQLSGVHRPMSAGRLCHRLRLSPSGRSRRRGGRPARPLSELRRRGPLQGLRHRVLHLQRLPLRSATSQRRCSPPPGGQALAGRQTVSGPPCGACLLRFSRFPCRPPWVTGTRGFQILIPVQITP